MSLSKLQKHIITIIANRTINYMDCTEYHDNKEGFISTSALFNLAYSYWEPNEGQRLIDTDTLSSKKLNKQRAAFSRSLHTLFDNNLIVAMVLAWCYLTATHGIEPISVHGGGHHKIRDMGDYVVKDTAQRFRLVSLTDDGWKIARELLGDQAGRCQHKL